MSETTIILCFVSEFMIMECIHSVNLAELIGNWILYGGRINGNGMDCKLSESNIAVECIE